MTNWRILILRSVGILGLLVVIAVAVFDTATDAIPKIDTSPTNRELAQIGVDQYRVVKVVDGDTIHVSREGIESKVRLIGVDTPESVDPRKPVQCFAKEAAAFVTDLLDGKVVTLAGDTSQDSEDKYGRLLRYVLLADGQIANQIIIEQGYGYEYTYETPYQYQRVFRVAQAEARAEGRGLWSASTCGGNR